MASSGLAKMANRMVARLEKAGTRDVVEAHVGQIFIWNKSVFEKTMLSLTDKKTVHALMAMWRNKLLAQDRKMMSSKQGKRLAQVKKDIIANNIEGYNAAQHEMFAVLNYGAVASIKRDVGKLYSTLSGNDSADVTGRIDKGDQASKARGSHIGHGEFGHAVSTTRALAAEAVMKTKTSQSKYANTAGFGKLESHITQYKKDMDINLEVKHHQELTARGRFSKKYTAILSSQGAGENMLEALGEKESFKKLLASVKEEYATIVTQEGSETLLQAVESVTLLGNLTVGKNVKYKGPAKPKKSSKSKAAGKAKGSYSNKRKASTISGSGAVVARKSRAKSRVKGPAFSPIAMIAMMNKQLPQTVSKNMKSPALNFQTGRLASSARVTDVTMTPQGFPSIGYTYDQNYRTFEVGGAQGSIDRDPRKLIDGSLREIAAQMAMTRFYTRRM